MPKWVRAASLFLAGCSLMALAMAVATLIAWRHFVPAADAYRRLSADPSWLIEKIIADVRGPLVLGGIVWLITAPLFGWLAFAVRVPRRRWAQITTWIATALGVFWLIFVLNTGLTSTSDGEPSPVPGQVGSDLAPGWYPDLTSILGVVTVALMLAGALALTRDSVLDYYRKASWQQDDRWSAFVTQERTRRETGS